jgi:transposase
MSLGRQRARQPEMLVPWAALPRSPGHVFYDKLQAVLFAAGFDSFVETQCVAEYAARRGRPSLPPARYVRMLLIGYFECIDGEYGLEWRCCDNILPSAESANHARTDPLERRSILDRSAPPGQSVRARGAR